MSSQMLYMMTGVVLFAIGLMALFIRRDVVPRIVGANIMASGVFLIIVTAASGTDADEADPVGQALVLTGIVISVSLSGVALGLARRLTEERVARHDDPGGDAER